MQNNKNKIINIARKGFADSLALALYKTDDLLDCLCSRGKEHSLPNVFAELYVRYCFAPSPDLRLKLSDLLPEGVGDALLFVAECFPYSEPPFATDLDYGNTRKIKDAIATRWKHFANADGAFPVCSENDAFLLPFYLYEHQENTSWVIDWNGNEIAEWNAAVEKLHIPYQVKVSISGNVKLEGHSLQLPVYLASLVKSSQFLPFDPYRFIATGAIENGLLKSVLFATKYDILCHKYANALFVCPKPSEDCIIADCNTGVMPVGFSLRDIRNFCSEFIVKHHLLKNEPENKSFSGRQYELSKIHSLLNPYSKQDKKIPLLLGASGIGKTALANQYAKIMTGCEYHDYALLNGDSSSLPDLFDAFYCSQINQERFCFTIPETLKTPKDKFESFLHQLKRCGKRVLFILDNLSPELQLNEDMKEFFPNYSESCIDFIATANICQFCVNDDDAVSTLEIDGLSIADGVRLLQNKRIIESAEEKIAAEEIVNFLGGNAWALTVVGETLKQTPEKFDDDYREKLKELRLLPLETLTPNSGMVRISYGKEIDPVKLLQPVLERLDPETLEIAQVAACCAPEYIYPDWLREYYELQHNVKFENEKQWRRKNIIAKLKQCNILTECNYLFHMHRLTRLVIKNLFREKNKQLETEIIDYIRQRTPMFISGEELNCAGCLIQELDIDLFRRNIHWIASNPGGDGLLSRLFIFGNFSLALHIINRGYRLYSIGHLAEFDVIYVNLYLYEIQILKAKGYFERAIACCEYIHKICQELNLHSSIIATIYHCWGSALENLGYKFHYLAVEFYEKELDAYKKTNNPSLIIRGLLDLACIHNNYCNTYAILLCEKALKIATKTNGIKEKTKLYLFQTCASVFISNGQYNYATEYAQKALNIAEKIYLENTPELLFSYQNFSYIYFRTSSVEIAEKYAQKALDLSLKFYGLESLHTATCYEILALTPRCQDRKIFLKKHLNILKKYFPENHKNIIKNFLNFADCLQKKDMKVKSEYLNKITPFIDELSDSEKVSYYRSLATISEYKEEFQTAEDILKCNILSGPRIMISDYLRGVVFSDIASINRKMQKWKQSIEYYSQAMEYFKKANVSEFQFNMIQLRDNLCYLYTQIGDLHSAIELRKKYIQKLFEEHAKTTCADLIFVELLKFAKLYSNPQIELSELEQVVDQVRVLRLPDIRNKAVFYNNYAKILRQKNRLSEAEKFHKSALEIISHIYPNGRSDTYTLKTNYARTLIELGRYDEAMKLEKESLEFRMATLPAHHENLAINYYDIGKILFKQGNFDKAITSLNSALNVTTMPEYQGRQITSEIIQELLDKIRSCQK